MCVHTAESPWMIMENEAKDNRLLKIGKEHVRLISSFDKISLQQHSISETNQRIFRGLVALAGATVVFSIHIKILMGLLVVDGIIQRQSGTHANNYL